MNEILQANIFFMITSIAVIIITILCAVALFYVVKVIRNVAEISDTVRRESEEIAKDVEALRGEIRQKGSTVWSTLTTLVTTFIINKFNKPRHERKK